MTDERHGAGFRRRGPRLLRWLHRGSAPGRTAPAEPAGPDDWLEDVEAVTLTVVEGLELREVGELLGFDWSTERQATFDQACDLVDLDSSAAPVQVGERDGRLVVVENNGYQATDEALLAELSRGGSAVCVFWNINARYQLSLARRGTVVRSLDPFLQDWEPIGDPLPEEEGLDFQDGSGRALLLELVDRLTGIRIDEEWLLRRPHRTWTTAGPPLP
ncbi:DUF6461 domain-containing protein [Blastococcus sp. SYSU D00820]